MRQEADRTQALWRGYCHYYWHYDVLRGLDYFRWPVADPDPRMAEAVAVVQSKRQPDGRWLLDRMHPGRFRFDLEAAPARRAGATRTFWKRSGPARW